MMRIRSLLSVPFALLMPGLAFGCFQSHSRVEVARDAGMQDAPRVEDAGGRLCGCPGREVRCVLPDMCCPATRTCENPSRFNCTGSAPRCE